MRTLPKPARLTATCCAVICVIPSSASSKSTSESLLQPSGNCSGSAKGSCSSARALSPSSAGATSWHGALPAPSGDGTAFASANCRRSSAMARSLSACASKAAVRDAWRLPVSGAFDSSSLQTRSSSLQSRSSSSSSARCFSQASRLPAIQLVCLLSSASRCANASACSRSLRSISPRCAWRNSSSASKVSGPSDETSAEQSSPAFGGFRCKVSSMTLLRATCNSRDLLCLSDLLSSWLSVSSRLFTRRCISSTSFSASRATTSCFLRNCSCSRPKPTALSRERRRSDTS
mmetsp:Transcript_66334/g.141943  ORF Transcript_66334/g.141943 Transcript_66334/m.141943 type:complete len:290 (-) Transcript_66334:521-1390(-)